jgi:hypothetical protein
VIAEDVSTPDDLDGAFQALARQRVDVLIVLQTSIGASAWKSVPIYRYVPRLFFSGRRSVGVHPRLNDLAEGINSILQKVPGGRSGHAQAIHRAVQSTELDRCLPELFPSHNFCNKDGRCPQRPLTPSVRLVRWL